MSFDFLMGVLAGIGLSMIGSWLIDRGRSRRHHTRVSAAHHSTSSRVRVAGPAGPARPDSAADR